MAVIIPSTFSSFSFTVSYFFFSQIPYPESSVPLKLHYQDLILTAILNVFFIENVFSMFFPQHPIQYLEHCCLTD